MSSPLVLNVGKGVEGNLGPKEGRPQRKLKERMTTTGSHKEYGLSRAKFYELRNDLKEAKKVEKSAVNDKWRKIRPQSRNPYND